LATVPIPDKLLWPTVLALKALGGSASNEELLDKVIELEGIPEKVASIIHSDNRQTKLNYNLAWARTNLKKIGAIDNSARGVWVLLAKGEKLSKVDVEKIPKLRRSKLGWEDVKQTVIHTEAELPETDWKDTLIVKLRGMDPSAFERLAQ